MLLIFPITAFSEQKMKIGRFQSRAIYHAPDPNHCNFPLVILVPGSGPNGPEEMVPGSLTVDGKDHSIFESFSEGLRRGNIGTLAIGKPGVEFYESWDSKGQFYDQKLYQNIEWQDLIENLKDAVDYGKSLPCVDPERIYLLGHSEGTQVNIDYSEKYPKAVRGLILVGFFGENFASTIDWQFYRRLIDSWLAPDVDSNQDGFISKSEASLWPEFRWSWKSDQETVSLNEIEQVMRAKESLKNAYQQMSQKKIWSGIFDRSPIYEKTAKLDLDIFIFNGGLDIQTRPEEALKQKDVCMKAGKKNCFVEIVPGLGHGMSKPKGPRGQKFLDSTLGPVDEIFKEMLGNLALKL
jgi:pimeloyl-ACP methyl ester carboxylesterase